MNTKLFIDIISTYDSSIIKYLLSDQVLYDIQEKTDKIIQEINTYLMTDIFIQELYHDKNIDIDKLNKVIQLILNNKQLIYYYGKQTYNIWITQQGENLFNYFIKKGKLFDVDISIIQSGIDIYVAFYFYIITRLMNMKSLNKMTDALFKTYLNKWSKKISIFFQEKMAEKVKYDFWDLYLVREHEGHANEWFSSGVPEKIRKVYGNDFKIFSFIYFLHFLYKNQNKLFSSSKDFYFFIFKDVFLSIEYEATEMIYLLMHYIYYLAEKQYDTFIDWVTDNTDILDNTTPYEEIYYGIMGIYIILTRRTQSDIIQQTKDNLQINLHIWMSEIDNMLNILLTSSIDFTYLQKILHIYAAILRFISEFKDNTNSDEIQYLISQWQYILHYVLSFTDQSVFTPYIIDSFFEIPIKYVKTIIEKIIILHQYYSLNNIQNLHMYAFFYERISNDLLNTLSIQELKSEIFSLLKEDILLGKLLYIKYAYNKLQQKYSDITLIEVIFYDKQLYDYLMQIQDILHKTEILLSSLFNKKWESQDPTFILFYIQYKYDLFNYISFIRNEEDDTYRFFVLKLKEYLNRSSSSIPKIENIDIYLKILYKEIKSFYSIIPTYFIELLLYLYSLDKNKQKNRNLYSRCFYLIIERTVADNIRNKNLSPIQVIEDGFYANIYKDIVSIPILKEFLYFLFDDAKNGKMWKKAHLLYILNECNIFLSRLLNNNLTELDKFFINDLLPKLITPRFFKDLWINKFPFNTNEFQWGYELPFYGILPLLDLLVNTKIFSKRQKIDIVVQLILNRAKYINVVEDMMVFLDASPYDESALFLIEDILQSSLSDTKKVWILYYYILGLILPKGIPKQKHIQDFLRKGLLYIQEKSPTLYYTIFYMVLYYQHKKDDILNLNIPIFPIFKDEIKLPFNKNSYKPLSFFFEHQSDFINQLLNLYITNNLPMYNKKLLSKMKSRQNKYELYELTVLLNIFKNKEALMSFLQKQKIKVSIYNFNKKR